MIALDLLAAWPLFAIPYTLASIPAASLLGRYLRTRSCPPATPVHPLGSVVGGHGADHASQGDA